MKFQSPTITSTCPAVRVARVIIISVVCLALEACISEGPYGRKTTSAAINPAALLADLASAKEGVVGSAQCGPAARATHANRPPCQVMQPDLCTPPPSIVPLLTTGTPGNPARDFEWESLHGSTGGDPGLWVYITRNLKLDHRLDERRVINELSWYQRNPDYLLRVSNRSQPYLQYVVNQVMARGMPAEFALLPIIESAYDPFAYSHGRAMGLWQFVPGTAKLYGLDITWWHDERRDVKLATDAALQHLQDLASQFNGDWLLALAAYNSGPGNVRRALRKAGKSAARDVFWELQLPRETRTYVPRLLALAHHLQSVAATLPNIPSEPHWVEVNFDSQIDVALAAELADLTVDEIYQLNPGLNRWATPPSGPHRLLLPVDKRDKFLSQLESVSPGERVAWKRHVIASGQTLGGLALQYDTSIGAIRNANQIRGNMIRAGDTVLIPIARNTSSAYTQSLETRAARRDAGYASQLGDPDTVHMVSAGDNLWDLSRKYGVQMHELARWNGMGARDRLMPGQQLKVYAARKPPPGPLARTSIRRMHYKVRAGESLAKIADKFKVSVDSIRKWNDAARGKYIQPGDRLTLYVDVTATGN